MKCPKCHFPDTYRKSPFNLTVHWDRCRYQWQVKQSLKPLLREDIYSSKPPKGKHTISVWYYPNDPSKYSFALTHGGGVCAFHQFDDAFLSGSYSTPQQALEAGTKEVKADGISRK